MQVKLISSIFKKVFLPFTLLALATWAYFLFYDKLELIFLKEAVECIDKWIFTLFAVIIAFLLQR